MSERTDEDLMQAASDGDMDAFGELVERHQQTAWKTAYWLVDDAARAEELAQDAFVKILEAAPRYEPTAQFTTYLNRVVTRLCYDWLEKHRPGNLEEYPREARQRTEPSPDDALEEDELQQRLRDALRELPERQRLAIHLQHNEEMSYAEIAEVMEVTEKAVEGLLGRARENLREILGDLDSYL